MMQTVFGHPPMSFEDLAAKMKAGDEEIKKVLQQGPVDSDKIHWKREALEEDVSHVIEISKTFQILSERELKRATSLNRLPKSLSKHVATLQVPSERRPSEKEWVYCFAHPDKPFRDMTIKTVHGYQQQKPLVPESGHVWERQCEHGLECRARSRLSSQGADQVFDKLSQNNLLTLSQFVAKHAPGEQPEAQASEAVVADNEEAVDDEEEEESAAEEEDEADAEALAGIPVPAPGTFGGFGSASLNACLPRADSQATLTGEWDPAPAGQLARAPSTWSQVFDSPAKPAGSMHRAQSSAGLTETPKSSGSHQSHGSAPDASSSVNAPPAEGELGCPVNSDMSLWEPPPPNQPHPKK